MSNWLPHIQRFAKGERLSADRMNEIVDALSQLMYRKQTSDNSAFGVKLPLHRAAVIGSTLTAPASSLAVATSCTVYFLDLQLDGTQVLNETPYTAYNDDPEVTADVGTYCRLEWLNGRWMIYYLGCDVQAALFAEIP
jgi:hypothetical protein